MHGPCLCIPIENEWRMSTLRCVMDWVLIKVCKDRVLWITPLQCPRYFDLQSPSPNTVPPTVSCDLIVFGISGSRHICCKAVIMQTSDSFCTCKQKRSHGDLICHSCISDFIIQPLRNTCNSNYWSPQRTAFLLMVSSSGTKWLPQLWHVILVLEIVVQLKTTAV